MQTPRPRRSHPKPIHLQPRDREALLMIYNCDGLMSEEQLLRSCYKDTHSKNAAKRLLALFDNHYLARNWQPEKWRLYPRLLYRLGSRGFDEVEQMLGIKLQRRNKPAKSRIPATLIHHLDLVDVRLKVVEDVKAHESLELVAWYTEGFFRSSVWQCKVQFNTAQDEVVEETVEPDAFFSIRRPASERREENEMFGYILEVDRATEVQQSFSGALRTTIDRKLRKGAGLPATKAYRKTFGISGGRCLLITSGWKRAQNMMKLAAEAGVARAWYFSTMEQALSPGCNLFTDPIWRKANRDEPVSLMP